MANPITTVGKVQQTTKYSMFKFVDGNRTANTTNAHYKGLRDSIEREGQITPAIVNGKMQILDGQHRFCACRELEKPFKFIIVDDVSTGTIADINEGRKWSIDNWINWYSVNGGKNAASYRYVMALLSEFKGVMSVSTAVRLINNVGSNSLNKVREGRMNVTAEQYNKVTKCFRELISLGYADWIKENRRTASVYWLVMAYLWRHPQVNMKRLIRLMWSNARKIPAGNMGDYMLAIEGIYNKGLKGDKKVYLSADYDQRKYWEW